MYFTWLLAALLDRVSFDAGKLSVKRFSLKEEQAKSESKDKFAA